MPVRRRRSWVMNLLIILCAFIFIYAAVRLIGILSSYSQNQKVQEELRDTFYAESASAPNAASIQEGLEKQPETDLFPAYDFTSLLEKNDDVKGWLKIPAAQVDHPVVQSADNDYYLHRNLYREIQYAGTIFMDYRCTWGESRNTVIYGHNMTDGSMFGHLKEYLKQSVWEENPVFWLITPQHVYQCDIFSVYLTTAQEEYARVEFADEEDFINYVEAIRGQSAYQIDGVAIEQDDRIITLSTCNYAEVEELGRQALHAKITQIS